MFKQIFLVGCAALAIAAIPSYVDHFTVTDEPSEQDLTDAVAINSSSSDMRAMRLEAREDERPSYVTGTRIASIAMDHSGHFIGNFRINGRTVKGVVDTGATMVAMNVSTARQIGLNPQPNDFDQRVATANGETRAAKVYLSRMEIGSITVSDVEAFVLDDNSLAGTLIGMSFMSKLDGYRVENRTLKLEK
ncbi:MAG: TIGR02281 family clan AA aspartic protease [Rhizobiales bacterium]|nr:TIGR02281 family clan AA aspartic protease [Hyphomicrobiales bacterium]MBA68123.1 TIGR02281 family clan AA aspartic protease [Hyphomicrobiales bacterium]|tara:strand:- start:48 stop:620 length:573 start_codon:yes stop_codon:yes gene_type:complete